MTLFHGLGIVAYSGVSGAAPGMVLLTPTSIAYSGTSASVGANGQVTFSAVTSLSLNGVFTADFDNYEISVRIVGTTPFYYRFRMRASGTDDSTALSYQYELIQANGTGITAETSTSNEGTLAYFSSAQRGGFEAAFYGPFLSQPTAVRSNVVSDLSNAYILNYTSTHNQSVSYDGFTVYGGTATGALQVYGIRS